MRYPKDDLLENINLIHTTLLGYERILKITSIPKNLQIEWIKESIRKSQFIRKNGKNYYVYTEEFVFCIHSLSYTVITVKKRNKNINFNYHFQIKQGWMNDPNGLIYYKGVYHVFYQYYPQDIKWGPMHWGHAISKDLLHFEELDIALIPDMEYEDNGGCFSGSAIVKDDTLYLIYTSVSKKYGQAQSLAYSRDGIHFTKYENNPIIRNYPMDGSLDFRDPKVFIYKDEYYMVVGSYKENNGRILLYKSRDLLDWEYKGIVFEDEKYHKPVECPDLFFLDGKYILMYSKIDEPIPTVFHIGTFDGNRFYSEKECIPEIGPHFYAPQTFLDDKNRRICIGWFESWNKKRDDKYTAYGAFNLPRELHIIDNEVISMPIIEAKPYEKGLPMDKEIYIFKKPLKITKDYLIYDNTILYDGNIENAKLYMDTKGFEIFLNNGRKNISYSK